MSFRAFAAAARRSSMVAAALACLVALGVDAFAQSRPLPPGSFEVATFKRLCPPGEVSNGSTCFCRSNQVRIGGICSDPPPPSPPAPVVEKVRPAPKAVVRPKPVKVATPDGVAGFETAGRPCLDGDLYDLVKASYGERRGLRSCAAACVPRPVGSIRSAAELDALAKQNGVRWCPESCVKLSGYMPPAEILRLERLTGRRFCVSDGERLCRAPDNLAVPASATVTKVLTLYRDAPVAPVATGNVAVVLGFGGYREPIPANDHAERDAEAVKAVLADKLGYPADAVVFSKNTTLADLKKLIGPDGDLAKKTPTESIFLYISGHGLSDPATGRAYILPVDGKPDDLANTALALQDLYEALGKLGAPSVTVVLEASFPTSVGELLDPPNLPSTEIGLLPDRPIAGLSVFTAADRDQQTLADPEYGTGLFTRYLLEGLAGAADEAPIGNGDRKIESVELYVYTAHRVRVTARKSFGLEQKPLISEARNVLLRSF